VARECLGSDPRLSLVTEDGAPFLRRQPAESFDLVFADAMPGKYEGLDDALAVVKTGGFYIIDDMLPQPNWPEGHAEKVPVLLERLTTDHRFVVAPLTWACGVVLAVRRPAPSRDNET
jgi:predicted O-methyltransferase YrrM